MRKAVYAKDSQSQRPQPVSNRQRSYRASGLALTGCQENAKMGNQRATNEGSDSRRRRRNKGCGRSGGAGFGAVKKQQKFFHSPRFDLVSKPRPFRTSFSPTGKALLPAWGWDRQNAALPARNGECALPKFLC